MLPAINSSGSDSAMLDNAIEFMVMSGMELPLAVMIAIPEPWASAKTMSQKKKDAAVPSPESSYDQCQGRPPQTTESKCRPP